MRTTIASLIIFLTTVCGFAAEESVYVAGTTEITTWIGPPGIKNMKFRYLGGGTAHMPGNKYFWDVTRLQYDEQMIQPNEAIKFFQLEQYMLRLEDTLEITNVETFYPPRKGNLVKLFKEDGTKSCDFNLFRSGNGVSSNLYISLIGCYQISEP